MHPHATPRTRSRCERLAARTESDTLVFVLSTALLLTLIHPVALAGLLLPVGGRLLADAAAPPPTGVGHLGRATSRFDWP